MDPHPGTALAARLKAALDAEAREASQAAQAERAASPPRAAVLAQLAAFGRALGHVEVVEGPRAVVLRYQGRTLRFEPWGAGPVLRVRGTDLMTGVRRVIWHPDRGEWVLGSFDRDRREHLLPLWDEGLAVVLALALGIGAEPGPRPPERWALNAAVAGQVLR